MRYSQATGHVWNWVLYEGGVWTAKFQFIGTESRNSKPW